MDSDWIFGQCGVDFPVPVGIVRFGLLLSSTVAQMGRISDGDIAQHPPLLAEEHPLPHHHHLQRQQSVQEAVNAAHEAAKVSPINLKKKLIIIIISINFFNHFF